MYRSQITAVKYPTMGLVRFFKGNNGNVALIYSGAWEVNTYRHGKEPDYYISDSAEAALNYYCKQVEMVK